MIIGAAFVSNESLLVKLRIVYHGNSSVDLEDVNAGFKYKITNKMIYLMQFNVPCLYAHDMK